MGTIWTGTTGASDPCWTAGRPSGETDAGPRLLVVDDDRRYLRLLGRILSQEDHHCLTLERASDVADALRAYPTIEVVISEVIMPDKDGIELIRSIRQQFSDRRWMQFILLAGRASIESAVLALEGEAVDYLLKPVTPRGLLTAVRRAVLRARAIRFAAEGSASPSEEARSPEANPAQEPQSATKPGLPPQVGGTTAAHPGPAGGPLRRVGYYESLQLLVRLQEARHGLFGKVASPDPSWEMLVELMLSTLAGHPVSVSSLCLASKAPTTTALRHIDCLIEAGLAKRRRDPGDRRRSYVDLSEAGLQKMRRYLDLVASIVAETADETGSHRCWADPGARAGAPETVAGSGCSGGGQHEPHPLER